MPLHVYTLFKQLSFTYVFSVKSLFIAFTFENNLFIKFSTIS